MAGASIFEVNNWEEGQEYQINDIYKYPNSSAYPTTFKYYYAIRNHNSGSSFDIDNSGGMTDDLTKPYFFWIPSYSSRIQIKPAIKKVQFGDGYAQRSKDGINNILLPFNLVFDKRSDWETRAILHFLHVRAGWESFVFIPPPPYNISSNGNTRLFVCEEWQQTLVFKDNNTIEATFIETPQ